MTHRNAARATAIGNEHRKFGDEQLANRDVTILRHIGGSRIFRGGGDFGNPSERSERVLRASGLTGE